MKTVPFSTLVRTLSWVGDALLILFALSLFLIHGAALTSGMAAVLALAVFLGGCLPLAVYTIEFLWARQQIQAAAVKAPETLRVALAEIGSLVQRAETAAADASRATLSARQVPAQAQEIVDRLQALGDGFGSLRAHAPDESAVPVPAPVSVDLSTLEAALTEIRAHLENALLVREDKLETIAERLESLEDTLGDTFPAASSTPLGSLPATVETPAAPAPAAPAPDQGAATPSEPSPAVTPPPAREDGPPPEAAPPPSAVAGEDMASATPPTSTKAKGGKAKRSRPRASTTPAASKEAPVPPSSGDQPPPTKEGSAPSLFGEEAIEPELPAGECRLIVKALVGVSNHVYARGAPPLDWEKGRRLSPTGIGEWRLELEGLSEPAEVELRLNDELPAKGGRIVLQPGHIHRASPQFPPRNEPF
ncbi:MAG: hypothetical protein ACLFU2_12555 [Opitutales bacterium]